MKNNKIKTFFIFLLSILIGCEVTLDEDEFKPQKGSSRLVVDALITDANVRHIVKLTKSTNFLDPKKLPVVKNATVVISDNKGFTDTLDYQKNSQGLYFTDRWQGKQGRTYTLTIKHEGKTYKATEKMIELPYFKIDSLRYTYKRTRSGEKMTAEYTKNISRSDSLNHFGQKNFGSKIYIDPLDTVYKVRLFAREIPNMQNYYQLEFFRNGNRWTNQNAIWVQDDRFLKENIGGIEVAGDYIRKDTVTVAMLALSKTAFQYYQDLSRVQNSVGGIVDPPPGNPVNNISGKALGLFQVSPVTQKTIIIGDPEYKLKNDK